MSIIPGDRPYDGKGNGRNEDEKGLLIMRVKVARSLVDALRGEPMLAHSEWVTVKRIYQDLTDLIEEIKR